MLQIRPEQLSLLDQAQWAGLAQRLVSHVRKHWPEACARRGEAATRASVEAAIRRGRELGLALERDIGRYVDLAFCFADDFEASPWARAVLEQQELPPRHRIERLWQAGRRALAGAQRAS